MNNRNNTDAKVVFRSARFRELITLRKKQFPNETPGIRFQRCANSVEAAAIWAEADWKDKESQPLELAENYDPSQPRDENGRFSFVEIHVEHAKGYTAGGGKLSRKSYLAHLSGSNGQTFDREFPEPHSTDWQDYNPKQGKGTFTQAHRVTPGYYEKVQYGEKTIHVASEKEGKIQLFTTTEERAHEGLRLMREDNWDFNDARRLATIEPIRKARIIQMVREEGRDIDEAIKETKPALPEK